MASNEICYGKSSGTHEPIKDVLQGWNEAAAENRKHNAGAHPAHKGKRGPIPSDFDRDYTYGMTTYELDVRSDPLHRSNAIIEQRVAQQERELRRMEAQLAKDQAEGKQHKKFDPRRPTKASLGHQKNPPPEPGLKDTFKMKRFTKFEHGKVDTGLRNKA